MTRRRRWAGDPRSYHDSPRTPSREIGFNLINTGLPKSPLRACISSRITTVIQVVKEPSNKLITVLMSRLQFRGIIAYT